MAQTDTTLPTYVDPVLNDVLDQIQFSRNASTNKVTGNDLTLLSAIAYLPLPTASVDPFDFIHQQQAINSILASFVMNENSTSLYSLSGTNAKPSQGTKASINTNIADAITKIILLGNTQSYLAAGSAGAGFVAYTPRPTFNFTPFIKGQTVNTAALTVNNINEAFYQAGSTIFLQTLCARINLGSTAGSGDAYGITKSISPNSPVNPSLSSSEAARAPTFQDVIDLTRYAVAQVLELHHLDTEILAARLKVLNVSNAAFQAWGASEIAKITQDSDKPFDSYSKIQKIQMETFTTLATDAFNYVLGVLNLTNASIINNPETRDALLTFGLGPWLVMQFMTMFQDSSASFVDQAYSRVAVYYAAMVALSNIPSSETRTLNDVVDSLQNQMNASFLNRDNTGPIATVLAQSQMNNETAAALALQSDSLKNRVGIASDLQTTYEYEKRVARTQKITFYAWLVAFIVVFVASVTLIVTDRVGVFLPFAYGTLTLIVAAFLLSWLVGKFYS